jgi:hypothetical protein
MEHPYALYAIRTLLLLSLFEYLERLGIQWNMARCSYFVQPEPMEFSKAILEARKRFIHVLAIVRHLCADLQQDKAYSCLQ